MDKLLLELSHGQASQDKIVSHQALNEALNDVVLTLGDTGELENVPMEVWGSEEGGKEEGKVQN